MGHGGSDELSVVNGAILIGIQLLEDLDELLGGVLVELGDPVLELLKRKDSVAVLVQAVEDVDEVADLFLGHLGGDEVKRSLFELIRSDEVFEL